MKISKQTIARTVLFVLAITNIILEKLGLDVISTDENFVLMCVETLVELGVIVTGFWYNNSYTENALKAQRFLEYLRNDGE